MINKEKGKMILGKIKKHYPAALIGIGILPIIFHAIEAFEKYSTMKTIGKFAVVLDKLLFQDLFESLLTKYIAATFGVLATSLLGIAIASTLIVYLVKAIKNPMKKSFISIIILGSIGILLNSPAGGILIIIGAAISMKRHSHENEEAPITTDREMKNSGMKNAFDKE